MNQRTRRILLAVINIIGYALVLVVNGIANALPLNGKTTGEVSSAYPNLFVPAGITFSIWGVIYLLLLVFVIFLLVTALRRDHRHCFVIDQTGPWFFFTCLLNAGWIFAWHYEQIALSLLVMALLLFSLTRLYTRLQVGTRDVSKRVKYGAHLAVSVYLGWISIATIANTTALLVAWEWNGAGLGDPFWAAVLIAAGVVLGLLFLGYRKDTAYALVLVWAYVGIFIRRMSVTDFSLELTAYMALGGIVILSTGIIFYLLNRTSYY